MINGFNLVFSILALIFSFLPLFLYGRNKMGPDKTFLLISIFWAINGIANVPEFFHWDWYRIARNQIILGFNLLDAPLILLIFYFAFRKKLFLMLMLAFFVFEASVIAWKGFNFNANKIIANLGGIIVLLLNIWGIIRYFRTVNHTAKDNTLVFVHIGFLFYYCLFFEITVVYGFLRSADSPIPYNLFSPYGLLICYVAIFLSTLVVSYGFWKYVISRPNGNRLKTS